MRFTLVSTLFAIFTTSIIASRRDFVKNAKKMKETIFWGEKIRKTRSHADNCSFKNEISNANGKIVRVIADNMLPYVTSRNDSDELGGYLGEVWTIIQTALKFKSKIISVNYDKGLDMMMEGKADVMLAAAVHQKMECCVTYSQPYYYNWYHLYMKKPRVVPNSGSYLNTLNKDLWFASLSLFLSLTLILWITLWIVRNCSGNTRSVSLPSCFLIVCSGFLNQGYDAGVRSFSARLQILNAIIFGYLLYTAMNAVLVSQLANYELILPFKNLDEVASTRSHSLCVRTNSFVYNNFTDDNKTLLAKWQGVVNGKGCLDINVQENIAKIICSDRVVILENRVVISAVARHYQINCDVIYLKKKLYVKPNSIVILKDFPFKRLLHFYFQRMQNNGILSRLEEIWVHGRFYISQSSPSTPEVTYHHIEGILLVFILMIVISLAILTAEIVLNKFTKVTNSPENSSRNFSTP